MEMHQNVSGDQWYPTQASVYIIALEDIHASVIFAGTIICFIFLKRKHFMLDEYLN